MNLGLYVGGIWGGLAVLSGCSSPSSYGSFVDAATRNFEDAGRTAQTPSGGNASPTTARKDAGPDSSLVHGIDATASAGSSGSDAIATVDAARSTDGPRAPPAEIGTDADAAPPRGTLSPNYHDYDVNHILVTGQSNCVSNAGAPPLSLTQPFHNLTFNTGVMHMGSCDGIGCTVYNAPTSLAPLVDGDEFFDFPTETASSGAGNQISFLAAKVFNFGTRSGYPQGHNVLVTVNGRSGNTYLCLREGGCDYQASTYIRAFAQGLMDVQNAMALAKAQGLTYVVRGVLVIHGESDHYDYTSGTSEFPMGGTDGVPDEIKDYGEGLMEWQRDYEAEIQAITGQTEPVYLFVSGLSGWTDVPASLIPPYQLAAHTNAHGKVILVTPGYPMQVYMDCEHYNDYGERRLGEYFAKAYVQTVFGGKSWEPVRPRTITRSDATIKLEYYVPVPPLVIDTTRVVENPSYGYTFTDNGVNATIESVALTGPAEVTVTLAAPPSGVNMTLSYAQDEPPVTTGCIGPGIVYARSASGNIRDSDMTPSYYSDANDIPYDMYNWGVIFTLPVQ